ncbi:MAG: hypothetical protein WA705_03100 [Candidatus Ozemobacteraceae bacterium]
MSIKTGIALMRMKIRLLWNGLRAWRWFFTTPLIGIFIVYLSFTLGQYMGGLIQMLATLLPRELISTALSIALVYAIILVFTSDLVTGHTLNWGQMSTDHAFLCTLPIPPSALLVGKLFERLAADWFSPIILLGSMLGIALHNGFSWNGLLAGGLLYLQIELLIGLFVTLLSIALGRLLRPTALRNLFGLLSYLSVIVTLGPILWSSNSDGAVTTLIGLWPTLKPWLSLPLEPARLVIEILLTRALDSSFWQWQVFWFGCFVLGIGAFSSMVNAQWLSWVHSGVSAPSVSHSSRFRGLVHKESMLLRNDLHLLLNSLLLPVTVIFAEIWALKGIFPLSETSHIMNAVAAAVIYFCMFGPVNSFGYEGKAISILETFPIKPKRIIQQKTVFWGAIALSFFVPASVAIAWYLDVAMQTDGVKLILWVAMFTVGAVWIAVSISALFPDYDSKVLQMRSTLTGKLFAALAMLTMLPAKSLSILSFLAFLIFWGLVLTLHARACEAFACRLDPDVASEPAFRPIDAALPLLSTAGVFVVLAHIHQFIVENYRFSIVPWMFAFVIGQGILGRSLWANVRRRFSSPLSALRCRLPSPTSLVVGIAGGVILGFAGKSLFPLKFGAHDLYLLNKLVGSSFSSLCGPVLTTVALIFLLAVIPPVIFSLFFRGFLDRVLIKQDPAEEHFEGKIVRSHLYQQIVLPLCRNDRFWGGSALSSFCFALLYPLPIALVVFFLGMFCSVLSRFSGEIVSGMLGVMAFHFVLVLPFLFL